METSAGSDADLHDSNGLVPSSLPVPPSESQRRSAIPSAFLYSSYSTTTIFELKALRECSDRRALLYYGTSMMSAPIPRTEELVLQPC